MHMKVLQDRSIVEEGVIICFRKRNETLTNEQEQYKSALCTLNEKVTSLREKLTEEANLLRKEEEVKVSVEKELMALVKQVETARANATAEFKASQPFIGACAVSMVIGLMTA